MINRHLTDNEIQEYVLQKNGNDMDAIKHIEHCQVCKIKASQYQLLFETIHQQENPAFEFDVADLVMAQLPQSGHKVSLDGWFSYCMVLIPILSLSILLYFLGDSFSLMLKGVKPIFIALVSVTITCLFVTLLFDMHKKYQAKMKALNFH